MIFFHYCVFVLGTNPTSDTRFNEHRLFHFRDPFRNSFSFHNGLVTIETLDKDRNVLAAILSIVVIAILATALAQPKWFSIYNDYCVHPKPEGRQKGNIFFSFVLFKIDARFLIFYCFLVTEGVSHIIENSKSRHFQYVYSSPYFPVTVYGLTPDFKGCATSQIITLKRSIICLCFLAIMCNLIQFFMDTMGTRQKWVNSMRIHAVGNIISVILCVFIIGLCYFVSILYERVQVHQLFSKLPNVILKGGNSNKIDFYIQQIQVKFELSYYLVTLAGFLSILASAANLFRRPRQIFMERISDYRNHVRVNCDENSLLNSDVLNNESSSASSNYVSYYSPASWLFSLNWNMLYNNHNNNNNNSNTNNSNTRQQEANTTATNVTATHHQCPPPPYSP